MATFDAEHTFTGRGGKVFNTDQQGFRLDDKGSRVRGSDGNMMYIGGANEGDAVSHSMSGDAVQMGANNTIVDAQLAGATPIGYQPSSYNTAQKSTVSGYNAPAQAITQGYGAANQNITSDQMLGDRLDKLLESDSPYIKQARNQGMLAAHSRGLLNSSASAGAAQAAATQAAIPIASQEAGVYSSAAANFANASNRASEFGAREANVAALQANQQEDASSRFGAAAENLASREFTQATNRAEEFGATAINRAGEFYAGAQNAASIQNANNDLSLSLQDMRTEISNYSTDMQRATALDNLGLNLFNTAMNSGVFNNADTIAGYFNTVAGIFPDLGIQLIDQAANTAAEEVVA